MSFILDALKKSENDRQRQSGPALFEVRVPPPRSKFPLLAVVIVSLLVVNLAVVAWIMLRKPAQAAAPLAQSTPIAPPPTQQAPGAQQIPQSAAPQMAAPGSVQPPPTNGPQQYAGAAPNAAGVAQYSGAAPANGYPPPAANNGYAPATANAGYPSGAAGNGYAPPAANNGYPQAGGGAYNRAPAEEPMLSDGAQQAPQGVNPDDYEPAREAGPPGAGAGRVTRGTDSGLPTYEEAATHASIPPLHMDLHSYAPEPSKRFVLINMRRLYEGQALPEGPKVESITSDAAIMSYQGTRFVLEKD
ncbi:MAG: general secretion pathway protein GspB [Gammaproteobacteria bacterium]